MSDTKLAPGAPQRAIGFRRRRQMAQRVIDADYPDRGDPRALMSASTHPNVRDEKPEACERHIILPTRKIIFGLQQIEHRPRLSCKLRLLQPRFLLNQPIGSDRFIQCREIDRRDLRSEEHTSELQSLMRISYA